MFLRILQQNILRASWIEIIPIRELNLGFLLLRKAEKEDMSKDQILLEKEAEVSQVWDLVSCVVYLCARVLHMYPRVVYIPVSTLSPCVVPVSTSDLILLYM